MMMICHLHQVVEIDGRVIGDGSVGPITKQLQGYYAEATETEGVPIPQPSLP
jgi:branched-subunit amino acid aminotransferase/4-amino-4-deoxychorismate lyase